MWIASRCRGEEHPRGDGTSNRKGYKGRVPHLLTVLGLHLRAGCPRRSPRNTCRIGRGCIASRGGREARQGSWEKRRRNQHGVWGASVGEVACSDPISRCRLSKPSDSCRLPGYGYGHLKSLFTQQERLEVFQVDAGRGTWPQPFNLGSTGCIYIRPDRMFPLHGSLGGSLISADCRLQTALDYKKSRGNAFLLLSFAFPASLVSPFHSPLFPHLCPFPLLGGRGRLVT